MTPAIATATFLCSWLGTLADDRHTAVGTLARELGTARALGEEIGRFIARSGAEDGMHAFARKEPPPAITPASSLRARVAWHTYTRLRDDELARLDDESDAHLEQMMERG